MNSKFKQIIGRERRNSKPPLKWLKGMTLLNANGDIDPTSFGYQYAVQTTEQIRAKVVKQVFFEIAPADFFPVIPGEGAWKEGLITNYSFDIAGPFAGGIINNATGPAKLAGVDAGIAPKLTPIFTWAKGYQYNKVELDKAVASGNWNPIMARQEALKRHYDLGLQKAAFLGIEEVGLTGFLNNDDVNIDTATITKDISAMSTSEFRTFVSEILGVYRENANRTAMPNKFVIPEADFLGLVSPLSPDFPMRSKLDYLLDADKDLNAGVLDSNGNNRYVLYADDAENLQMDVPVPFQLMAPGTADNFTFQGVSVSQFGPVVFFRPRTAIYFDHE